MDLAQNYFELFAIEEPFELDKVALAEKYRQLQKELHPDKFASKSAGEQRLAVQFTSYVNTAYQTLSSPLLLAEYVLEEAGHPVNSETLTINAPDFLLKQMEWREHLADIAEAVKQGADDSEAQLDTLVAEASREQADYLSEFRQAYEQQQYDEAKTLVAKLHFVNKMLGDIDRLQDSLFD